MPYTGTGCKEFLEGRNVYIRPRETQDSVENQLKMLFRGKKHQYSIALLVFDTSRHT